MESCDLRYSDKTLQLKFFSSNIVCLTRLKNVYKLYFPVIMQSLDADYLDLWLSSSGLRCTLQGLHPAGFSHRQPAIDPPPQELAWSALGPRQWLSDLFGSIGRRPRPNRTASKRKSYQVLLCLDSPDVIYSLVYEVFSWPCWLGSTHFVILEYTRPVTWWQCALSK